jgi:hypothetical protein
MLAAIRRASSNVSMLAAGINLEIDVAQGLSVIVPNDETCVGFFYSPGRRETARRHFIRHSTPSSASTKLLSKHGVRP